MARFAACRHVQLRAEAQRQEDLPQWLSNTAAPWAKFADEKPKGETLPMKSYCRRGRKQSEVARCMGSGIREAREA